MFTLRNLVKGSLPKIPFKRITEYVLDARYDLSFVVCGEALSRTLNGRYRKKRGGTNVLSFPLNNLEGEIFINMPRTRREAKIYNKTLRAHMAHLFIHALLHLKGYAHGSKMNAEEQEVLKRFKLC